jgi:phage repressor protein C with HTH and peptisase S24 domain
MKTGDIIRKIRQTQKLTISEVESRAGLSEGNLSRVERGLQWPTEEKFEAIARALGVSVADLFAQNAYQSHVNAGPEHEIPAGKWVAIVGIGKGGPDGFLSIDDYSVGNGDGQIYTYSRDPNAYGIRVRGDSMRPRIKSGEYIVAEPGVQSQPGDDVVVRLNDGLALVKELLWIRDDEVSLGSINNDVPSVTIQIHDVKSIHRVAAIVPRGSALLRSWTE